MRSGRLIAGAALIAWACWAPAQSLPDPAPRNVLQLSAVGTAEVQQDLLSLTLTTTREGADPRTVQSQLNAALDAALAEARKSVLPGQMEARTGAFGLSPRYYREGKISGWNGSAELILAGRDFERITQTAARIQSLTVSTVSFGLSREQRAKVEEDAQAIAVERFKVKAAELAKAFGFSAYSLREVTVNSNGQGIMPRQRAMALEARAGQADMAVPVEAGKTTVTVTVSGSVQLR